MEKGTYQLLENYMILCMDESDSVHDRQHIYRVLYYALDIAQSEEKVDYDVLVCACLLHDIGRKEQLENPKLCHARVGADKAFRFLVGNHFEEGFAQAVAECIRAHRYRCDTPPQSIEARILFDADKIDVAGAVGIARTLMYKGILSGPLYCVLPDGAVSDGKEDGTPSFFQEYQYKLKNLYSGFYTKRARAIAGERQQAAEAFYEALFREVGSSYEKGTELLKGVWGENGKKTGKSL